MDRIEQLTSAAMSNKKPSGNRRNLWLSFQRIMRTTPSPRIGRKDITGRTLLPPKGQPGSATNPRGPRSRRARYWTPVSS